MKHYVGLRPRDKDTTRKAAGRRGVTVTYTHRDATGMLWRFIGGRPVSALADKVMLECGLPLR